MMKRLLSCLLMLCLLPVGALADEPVQYWELVALRNKLAEMREELAAMEAQLAEMEWLYAVQNSNRRIVFEQDAWMLINGRHMKLTPEVVRVKDDAPNRTELRWESSDPAVAWIDRETGRVYAKAPGVAEITCWALDDAKVSAKVTIQVVAPVESISLSESSVLLYVRQNGGEVEKAYRWVGATVKPENAFDKTLTWTSDDESVVTITDDGLLLAKGVGKATVTATANDGSGVRARMTVRVVQGIESLTLSHTEATVTAGKKLRLSAAVLPADAGEQKLIWHSSDESVATVTTKGVVYAEKPGVCTITATTTDGTEITAECAVTVVE